MLTNNMLSISGIDGCGKTTQLKKIVMLYQKKGAKCIEYNQLEPTEPIENMNNYFNLLKPYDVIMMRPYARSTEQMHIMNLISADINAHRYLVNDLIDLIIEDITHWFDVVVLKLLAMNKILLFDRYCWDELSYLFFYTNHLEKIDNFVSSLPHPKSTYLSIDLKTMKSRNINRSDRKKYIFSKDKYIKKILNGYDLYVLPKCDISIPASLDIDSINNKILTDLEVLI